MTQRKVDDERLQRARDALARHAWRDAFDVLKEADAAAGLDPQDLEGLADAAWWTGRLDDCIGARERAYALYVDRGERRGAARTALQLARDYGHKLANSVAAGWMRRAQRLLQDEPESREHGWLARARAVAAIEEQADLDAALEHTSSALEIGARTGDRDLQAIALHDQGRALVASGRVEDGMALLDEAMVAAVSGELGPSATGIIYCNMISICERLADYRRAGEWTDAAKRWCERQSITGFPGICRVHRAEIMRLRGAWTEAELEARQATDELRDFYLQVAGKGLYEIGEIRLHMGDFAAAEEAFQQAHEMGREPQPGLALLRLAQGRLDAAAAIVNRALSSESLGRLDRARLLPAQVEIALAAADLDAAEAAAAELQTIADDYATPALHAAAAHARGAVQLAQGDAPAARQNLGRCWRLWQELDIPYEAARVRLLLGQAYRAEGDEDAAVLELRAARATFDRLGALPDARRAAELLDEGEAAPVPALRDTKTFMFTDICKSTDLVEAIGDEAWEDLLRWHDQTLRSLFAAHGGEEIKQLGEGFFVAFPGPESAIDCALAVQRTLAEHRRSHGFAPQVRIGLHTAEATRRGRDYGGKGVHAAARIGAVAEAGEILASQETVQNVAAAVAVSQPRSVNLKGISRPVQVVSLQWR